MQVFTSSRLWKAFPDELPCTRCRGQRFKLSPELHQSLSFQMHSISQDTSSTSGSAGLPTCTTSPVSHRLQEPFSPARPNHRFLLFPSNLVGLQGKNCSLQVASSTPEQLDTLQSLLSQVSTGKYQQPEDLPFAASAQQDHSRFCSEFSFFHALSWNRNDKPTFHLGSTV